MRVILDVDPGCDDAMALAAACGHPDVDLAGVTTVAGNAPVADTTRNARSVLALCGADEPVARGAAGPLAGDLHTAEFVHGPGGLRGREDLPDPDADPVETTAAEFLVDRAADVDVIASVGPPTNLALALALDPALPERVDVWSMGGAMAVAGNVTPAAEANYANDPEAAKRVVRDATPSVVPLDVTERATLAADDLPSDGPIAAAIADWLDYPDDALDRAGERVAVHDAAVVAELATRDVLSFDSEPMAVATEGTCRGALTVDRRGVSGIEPNARIATAIDVGAFRDAIRAGIERLPLGQ
jgi:purine nucleosidase